MKITENPFYLLGATPRDNRQKIQDLVDEKMLELDSTVCAEARQTLTNPRKRLSAEIAWFPGVSIRQINTIIIELVHQAFGFYIFFIIALSILVCYQLIITFILPFRYNIFILFLELTLLFFFIFRIIRF